MKKIALLEKDDRIVLFTQTAAKMKMHPSKDDEIGAYAIINPGDVDEMVVGLIDGEWYKFLPKE